MQPSRFEADDVSDVEELHAHQRVSQLFDERDVRCVIACTTKALLAKELWYQHQ